jgi:hypothetical protein
MSKQTQWLFEALVAPAKTYFANPYTNLEFYSDPEVGENCRIQTSDCPSSGASTIIVSGYLTHAVKVPAGEQRKIKTIADSIRNIDSRSEQVKLYIVGHADKDPSGENYERDISRQRAEAVREALRLEINDETIWSKVKQQLRLFCARASNPIVSFKEPLARRARNRRVEIFLSGIIHCLKLDDVVDARIDIGVQKTLLRMCEGNLDVRLDAVSLVIAVKAGQLIGIYGDDLPKAELVKKLIQK